MNSALHLHDKTTEKLLKLPSQGHFVLALPPSRMWLSGSARMGLGTCCAASQKEFVLVTENGQQIISWTYILHPDKCLWKQAACSIIVPGRHLQMYPR